MPELVPTDLWGRSAHNLLRNSNAWKNGIRPNELERAGHKCELCGAKDERLICHDKWKYDDRRATVTLIAFEIHCRSCDSVTHLGLAMKFGPPEEVLKAALLHLCRVNNCQAETGMGLIADAFAQWDKWSANKWKIKVSVELLGKYPELKQLPGFNPGGASGA